MGNCLCVSNTKILHDVVVEDLLWNFLDGNVLKQRGKDRSLENLSPQKGGAKTVTFWGRCHPIFHYSLFLPNGFYKLLNLTACCQIRYIFNYSYFVTIIFKAKEIQNE